MVDPSIYLTYAMCMITLYHSIAILSRFTISNLIILLLLHIFTLCYIINKVRCPNELGVQNITPRHLFGLIKTHISPPTNQNNPPARRVILVMGNILYKNTQKKESFLFGSSTL